MTSIGFLHVSDLHVGQKGQAHLWPAVRERLFEDLGRLHDKTGPWQVLLFSGDLTYSGTPAEFKQLDEIIEELIEHTTRLGSRPLLLAVPGNHDLQRPNAADPVMEALRLGWNSSQSSIREQFWTALDAQVHGKGKRQRNQYLALIHKAFCAFVDWQTRWFKAHPLPGSCKWRDGALPGDFVAELVFPGTSLVIVGLNSAFLQLSGGDHKGMLALGIRQLQAACGGDHRKLLGEHPLSLLMTHHPPDWLDLAARRELDSEIAPPGLFSAHLFGHMHDQHTSGERISGAPLQVRHQAASLFGLEKTAAGLERRHGYAAGRLTISGASAQLRLWPRNEVVTASGVRRLVADTRYLLDDDISFVQDVAMTAPTLSRSDRPALVSAPLAKVADDLLKAVAAERRSHLFGFAGRGELLAQIQEQLQLRQAEGGYLLLVGHEGSGKSALCAKLTEQLTSNEPQSPLSGDAARLGHLFPWLPRSLLCMCKQVCSPAEVVQLILAQAGVLLGELLQAPTDSQELGFSLESLLLSSGLSADGGAVQPQLRRRQELLWKRYQRVLFDALERVTQRVGHCFVVVDAADELQLQSLGFLPPRLPAGMAMILTTRPGALEHWCVDQLQALSLPMPHLTRAETAQVTGVNDEQSEPARRFNDRVHGMSSGWPLLVATVAQDLRKQGGRFEGLRIEGQLDALFERQAGAWRTDGLRTAREGAQHIDPLRELLLLLTVFEPVTPLSFGDMQGYLEHLGVRLPRGQAEVRLLLGVIAEQLQGFDGGRIRLALKAFAESVWQHHLSQRDRRRALVAIVAWLTTDNDVRKETKARFIYHYAAVQQDAELQTIAGEFLEQLATRREFGMLRSIANELFEIDDESPHGARCTELAAQGGDIKAMLDFGDVLILGRGRASDPGQGLEWLERATAAGSLKAKSIQGFYLSLGLGVKQDRALGERYLREAAEAGTLDQLQPLIIALWVGALGPNGWQEAFDLLRDAVRRGLTGSREQLLFHLKLHALFSNKNSAEIADLERQLLTADNSELAVITEYSELYNELKISLKEFIVSHSPEVLDAIGKNDFSLALKKGFELGCQIGLRLDGENSAGKQRKSFELFKQAVFSNLFRSSTPDRLFLEAHEDIQEGSDACFVATILKQEISNFSIDPMSAYLRGDFASAARQFLMSYKLNSKSNANSLAYMLRRGEVPADLELPGVFELLDAEDSAFSEFVAVNRALCYARGFQCESDWPRADELIASLKGPDSEMLGTRLLSWWLPLSQKGDPEGHLVIGWLLRHKLTNIPDTLPLARHFAIARDAGWAVPEQWDSVDPSTP